MVIDIKRAYFYAPARQTVYVKLPPEDPRAKDPSVCGKLLKSLYGTRDAGANWHAAYSAFLKRVGLCQGVANPCHFSSAERLLKGLVHGDDFLFTGSLKQLQWLRTQFEAEYECKVEMIGIGPDLPKSARFLNRVITFTDKGIEFEGDQRLVEALVDGLQLTGANLSPCPGSKPMPIPKSEHQLI